MKLQIEKVVYGGAGLAHLPESGKAVFVPLTLPGEAVEAELSAASSVQGEASLMRVIAASADRVEARCRHFGACGGCQLQHAQYGAQVRMKAEILRETLERAGVSELPEVQVHAAEPWGYRNRVRMRLAVVDGTLCVGYNRRGSNAFLPVEECPIAGPLLWRTANSLLALARRDAGAERWLRTAVEVELFTNGDESKLQMTLFVRKPLSSGFEALCKALQHEVPELVGAGVSILPSESAARSRRL